MWNQVGGTLSNSMAQAMGRFASLLPGILAFLLAVVLFSLIGWLLAWVVRRILISLHFDEKLGRGTDAVTRVLVESTDRADGAGSGATEWTTVGVHGNVVEASWLALVDALAYAAQRRRAPLAAGGGGRMTPRGSAPPRRG